MLRVRALIFKPATATFNAPALSKDIRVKSLYIHPIKSCKGTSVQEATYTHDGLCEDRTWLIIDAETKQFQTARQLSRMLLIHPHIDFARGVLRIDVPLTEKGKGTISVETPLEPTEEQLSKMELVEGIKIWISEVDGYAVSKEADEALSEFFGRSVRLVRKGPTKRASGPDDRRNDPTLNFQDFYPILVANQASIEHVRETLMRSIWPSLSSKADTTKAVDSATSEARKEAGAGPVVTAPVGQAGLPSWGVPAIKAPNGVDLEYWSPEHIETLPIIRFRPNILLESPDLLPWEEDGFTELEIFDTASSSANTPPYGASAIGAGRFGITCMARCGRCLVTTIDPETGVKDKPSSSLPYKVLQGFRRVEPQSLKTGKPCFGMLSAIKDDQRGERLGQTIRVGDTVRVVGAMDPRGRAATQK
ncbi:hypothetical protein BDZ90DRAFT_256150 [Jaminaea rosea]|uniref:MOSC domain-containing protein n=1 Tax=Jaminaea rosea TaxID=1569628 RepID=A0A316UI02_9BASI|nr:hypothetical protein BDZ90DRAFT_256150 [Jaminaea rosea]PWN24926.1 hypothetical protein BDZ90DRAFT_256150 [Jaminaea rosea]